MEKRMPEEKKALLPGVRIVPVSSLPKPLIGSDAEHLALRAILDFVSTIPAATCDLPVHELYEEFKA